MSQAVSIVVSVSGLLLAGSVFVPALSAFSNHLMAAFVISVHLQPWFRDTKPWLRTLSIIGLIVYLLTLVLTSTAVLIIIPVVTTLTVLWGGMFSGAKVPQDRRTQPDIQLPAPANKRGAVLTGLTFIVSQLLALLNPFQLAQIIAQTYGLMAVFVSSRVNSPRQITTNKKTAISCQ